MLMLRRVNLARLGATIDIELNSWIAVQSDSGCMDSYALSTPSSLTLRPWWSVTFPAREDKTAWRRTRRS